MYNSTERINTIYKVTIEAGNIQTKKTNSCKTVVKKGSKFHQARCNTVRKNNFFWQKKLSKNN